MNPNQNSWPQFTDVTGGQGQQWKPHSTELNGFYYNPQDPNNVQYGFLKGRKDITSQYGAGVIWQIHTAPLDQQNRPVLGPIIDLFEDAFLGDKLAQIPLGTFIRIEYLGKALTKKSKDANPNMPISKTNSYHNWKIQAWEKAAGAPDYNAVLTAAGLSPVSTYSAPVQQPVQQQQGYNQAPQNAIPATMPPPPVNPMYQGQQNNFQQPVQQQPFQQQGQQTFQQQQPVQQQNFNQQQPVQNQPFQNPNQGYQQFNGNQNMAPVQQQQPVNLPPAPNFQQPAQQQQPVQNQPFQNQNQQPVQNNGVGTFGGQPLGPNPFTENVTF